MSKYIQTAHMFMDDNTTTVAEFKNDDMFSSIMEFDLGCNNVGYNVDAGSYDGQMHVCEQFQTLEIARTLYNHIIEYYSDTPPIKRRLKRFIKTLHLADMQTSALTY